MFLAIVFLLFSNTGHAASTVVLNRTELRLSDLCVLADRRLETVLMVLEPGETYRLSEETVRRFAGNNPLKRLGETVVRCVAQGPSKPFVVSQGQECSVVYKEGALTVEKRMKALENGRAGQRIRFSHEDGRPPVFAWVDVSGVAFVLKPTLEAA